MKNREQIDITITKTENKSNCNPVKNYIFYIKPVDTCLVNLFPLANDKAKPKLSPNNVNNPVFPIAALRSKNDKLTLAGQTSGITLRVVLQEYTHKRETSQPFDSRDDANSLLRTKESTKL